MIVLLGESAAGKSTIQHLLSRYGYRPVVTYTTRPMRQGEQDGKDYHFITEDRFHALRRAGFFGECTQYRDWHYGTSIDGDPTDQVVVVSPGASLRVCSLLPHG